MIDPALMMAVAEETKPIPRDEQLASIADLARMQFRLEREVEDAENTLEELKEKLARVSEVDLPEALAAVGMEEFSLEGGYKVSVAKEYYASIPSADSKKAELLMRREAALKWLRENGNEALIKHTIAVETGRGDDALAQEACKALEAAGISYKDTEEIHWQTLRAFVREQMERPVIAGEEAPVFPEQLFGAYVKRVASIKAPRMTK